MVPFAYSEMNRDATGHFFDVYLQYIPKAVSLVAIAVIAVGLGSILALSTKKFKPPGLETIISTWSEVWLRPQGIISLFGLVVCLVLLMLALGFTPGDARTDAFQRPELRAIYNLFSVSVSFAILATLGYALMSKKKRYYALGLLLVAIGLFGGTRATSVGLLITIVALWAIVSRTRKLFTIIFVFLGLALALVYVLGFRSGVHDLSFVLHTPEKLLYGNTFSDFRDFTWILSGWDEHLKYGVTYLSGFLSFIPSAFWPLRTELSWGQFSLVSAGLGADASQFNPGLRPIIFGEPYFNFGIIGLIVWGMAFGFFLTHLTRIVDSSSIKKQNRRILTVIASIIYMDYVLLQFFNSSGFFTFYAFIAVTFLGMVLKALKPFTYESSPDI